MMNGFLWLGVVCTVVLVIAVAIDGLDDAFDALDFGPSWVSLPVLAAFGGAFGFVTGALVGDKATTLVPVIVGIGAGFAFAAATVKVSSAFVDMPTDPTERQADLLGSIGKVIEAPAVGRFGAVLLRRPTGPIKVAAIAESAIEVGTEVVVVDVTSSTLVTVEAFHLDDLANDP